MTYADDFNLRDKDTVSINDVADAADGLRVHYEQDSFIATQNTSSSTYATVGGLSKSVTTTAKQIVLIIGNLSWSGGTADKVLNVAIFRDAVQVQAVEYLSKDTSSTGVVDCCILAPIDEPGAGTFTYTIQWNSDDNSSTFYSGDGWMAVLVFTEDE